MATVSLYLDRRRVKDNGKYPIKINIRHINKFLIGTKFEASSIGWSGDSFNKKEPDHNIKNAALRNLLTLIEKELFVLESTDKLRTMSDKMLKSHIETLIGKNKKNTKCFIDYLDEFIDRKTNSGTKTVYTTTRNKISQYDPSCTFDTITNKWLEKFEKWMADDGMKTNSIAINMRNIRAVFNYAIDEEYTSLYPFRKYKIKKEVTRKRSLTADQLITLRDYQCEDYQERYRDMFMLMFYLIGINAADLFMSKWSDVVNGRLEYKRAKTGRLYSVLIEPEAWEIINRYKGKDYLLNVMDDYGNYKDFLHRMGIALKQIGDVKRVGRGGKKVITPLYPELSSYWARHTWATIAAELDIPKETIAHALGHSWADSTTTDIYIRFDNSKVDKANRCVIDRLKTTIK